MIFSALSIILSVFLYLPARRRTPPIVGMLLIIGITLCFLVSTVTIGIALILAPVYTHCIRTPHPTLAVGFYLALTAFIISAIALAVFIIFAAMSIMYVTRIEKLIRGGHKAVCVVPSVMSGLAHSAIAATVPHATSNINGSFRTPGRIHPPAPPPQVHGLLGHGSPLSARPGIYANAAPGGRVGPASPGHYVHHASPSRYVQNANSAMSMEDAVTRFYD